MPIVDQQRNNSNSSNAATSNSNTNQWMKVFTGNCSWYSPISIEFMCPLLQ